MEDDRRKKKNKKNRKNKQATAVADKVPIRSSESTSDNQNSAAEIRQDIDGQLSGATETSDDVGGKMDADIDDHLSRGIELNLTNSVEPCSMNQEANLQNIIEQLRAEKDEQMEKEAILLEKIKEYLKEKDELLLKLDNQEEAMKEISNERTTLIEKQGILTEKLEQARIENDAIIQEKDFLEEKIIGLQMEKDTFLQKENSFEESMLALKNENARLQAQVENLEESRKGLLDERRELTELISGLQLQMKNLENTVTLPLVNAHNDAASENGIMSSQLEAMDSHIKSSASENSELVDEVTSVLDVKGVITEDYYSIGSKPGAVATQLNDSTETSVLTKEFSVRPEANMMKPVLFSAQPLNEEIVKNENDADGVNDRSGSSGASEIVQIPFDEYEVKGNSLEATQNGEITDASLIDAPLIGAPFRFISFVARYVSGADLVNKNRENSV